MGGHLRAVRLAAGLSLRAVEDRTGGRVRNGYLSQIENGDIKRPSPSVLRDLAEVFGLDYAQLLERAGHPVPAGTDATPHPQVGVIAGIPTAALADLTEAEAREVLDFLAFVKSRRVALPKD